MLLVSLFALVRTVLSFRDVPPLETTPGFDEAVAFTGTTYPSAIVVVPPLQTQALDKIPLTQTATDAVPDEHANVVFLRRTDEPLVEELQDERIMTHKFGDVEVDHVDRAP